MSPPAFLDSDTGQFSSLKSSSEFYSLHNDMNPSSSNSNHGFPNSNEQNPVSGFNSPPLASFRAPAGSGSNLSRPRLMKMRRQSSHNPRSTTAPASRRGEGSDLGLGFNPFRTSSESIFGSLSSGNVVNETFSFGATSNSNDNHNRSLNLGVLDDMSKLKIDVDRSYPNFTFGNAEFNSKVFDIKNKKSLSFNDSMINQLPKEINNLNIRDSSNYQNVNPMKSQFTNPFRNNVELELQNGMHKMNLGCPNDNSKSFVFGRSEVLNPVNQWDKEAIKSDLISDKMPNLKVSDHNVDPKVFEPHFQPFGNASFTNVEVELQNGMNKMNLGTPNDNSKSFVFGRSEVLNPVNQHDKEAIKPDLISDKMHDLKVSDRNVEPKVFQTNFQSFGNASFTNRSENNLHFTFSSKLDKETKTPDNTKGDLFSGSKSVFEAKKEPLKDTKSTKKKGKLRKPVTSQPRPKQNFAFETPNSFEAYSPMDVSPYRDNYYSREPSITSEASSSSQMNDHNSVSSESHINIINSNVATDEDLLAAAQRLDVNDVSETESFNSATENIYSSDTFVTALDSEVSSTATSERTGTRAFKFGSKLENISKDNFTFAASSSGESQLSPDTRQHKKKHRLKTVLDSFSPTSDAKNKYSASSGSGLFVGSGNSSILSHGKVQKEQKVDISALSSKNKDGYNAINDQDSSSKHRTASASVAVEEACEKWRLRGNQAYSNGDLAKAEDYYTQGVNSVSQTEKSRSCLRALMLCYSNRAATRISLGRMREALKDCLMAAAIDPNFLKVRVRAANCYLAIGEVENATIQYMKCLQSGSDVCVDRKLLVEASEGLENTQKVSECIKQYNDLLQRTSDDFECALRIIAEALQISNYSDQLLQMKADTLFKLRRYEQVIQMFDNSPSSTEMVSSTSFSSWRSCIVVKSYFYLGRLEEALEFIKKQEILGLVTERLESMSLESVIPLADTIRKLLSRKAAGNEAFKSGKHAEAVEHYTAALSCSVESRPFAAILFCNRAAAYRTLGQITDAIADCCLAIALDPSYFKAISRRAGLYEMIRDYGQAALDLRRLVSLLTTQIERNGVSDKLGVKNEPYELRQTLFKLSNIEEESRKGIPLNMYLILGIESSAAASEIKKAYRKAALKHHPDKAALSLSRNDNGDDELWKEIAENVHKDADRLFKMIGEAYAVLSNPSKRSRYDLDEEMRIEANKFTRSSSGRMSAEIKTPVYEQSTSNRQWQDSWRPYVNTQSKPPEKTGSSSSYRYSRYD